MWTQSDRRSNNALTTRKDARLTMWSIQNVCFGLHEQASEAPRLHFEASNTQRGPKLTEKQQCPMKMLTMVPTVGTVETVGTVGKLSENCRKTVGTVGPGLKLTPADAG